MRLLFCGISCAETGTDSGFTSLIVQSGTESILIDSSDNPVRCLLRAGIDPRALKFSVLTHGHTDHIYGYPALLHTLHCRKRKGPLTVLLPGRHSVPSSMVRVAADDSRLLYTADTASWPGIAEAARGCDALVHEATASQAALENDPDLAGHSSALQAGQNAAAAGVKILFLCHLCGRLYDGRDPADEAARAFGGQIVVPEPFRWYEL
jgi:ribonuclease BN (tRNA processing enzyme)